MILETAPVVIILLCTVGPANECGFCGLGRAWGAESRLDIFSESPRSRFLHAWSDCRSRSQVEKTDPAVKKIGAFLRMPLPQIQNDFTIAWHFRTNIEYTLNKSRRDFLRGLDEQFWFSLFETVKVAILRACEPELRAASLFLQTPKDSCQKLQNGCNRSYA